MTNKTPAKPIIDREDTYIPVKNLSVVWAQSQRPYNPRWAKEIADNFDPDLFDHLIVTMPNGEGVYHIVEGQHRRHALEMYAAKCNPSGKGDTELAPCRVIDEVDPARAAAIWLGVNKGRKAIKPIQAFIVAVTAEFEAEVKINDLLIKNGYHVASEKKTNHVAAVGALRTVYDRHGQMILNNVLRCLRVMWDGDPNSTSSPMLRGFGLFLNEFGMHVDMRRLVKIAEKWSPYKVYKAAEAKKQNTMERIDESIADFLFREYNKGMKEGSKLKRKG